MPLNLWIPLINMGWIGGFWWQFPEMNPDAAGCTSAVLTTPTVGVGDTSTSNLGKKESKRSTARSMKTITNSEKAPLRWSHLGKSIPAHRAGLSGLVKSAVL